MMSDYAPYEDADDCIAALSKERDELREALTFIKTGPLGSMLSAASEAPIGPDAMVAVPVDLIRHWDEVVSEALATVSTLDAVEKDEFECPACDHWFTTAIEAGHEIVCPKCDCSFEPVSDTKGD